MYNKILEDIRLPYYQQNYSNDGQRFVAWYLKNIHLRTDIETKAEITDGADDKQIDAIYVDDNSNTIFIIQGKFIGSDKVDSNFKRGFIFMGTIKRFGEIARNRQIIN